VTVLPAGHCVFAYVLLICDQPEQSAVERFVLGKTAPTRLALERFA
jgi:hypothetical protein